MAKKTRKSKEINFDAQSVGNNCYNDYAGAQKNLNIGPKLLPIKLGETTWTTDASVARQFVAGTSIYVFNTNTLTETIAFGKTQDLATPMGVGDVDAEGNVAIPVIGEDWSHFSLGEDTWVRTSSSNVKVFVVQDHTIMS